MTEDPITVLEERVRDLELKVFGQVDSIPDVSTNIVDILLENHKVVSSALSGREKMAAAVKQLDQLEGVLDPLYEDTIVDSAAKLAFILALKQPLEEITKQLVRVSELSPCLESEQLRNIPNLAQQLAKLTLTLLELKEKHDLMQEGVDDLITKYTEVTNGVTAVFATLDNLVTNMEIKAQPKIIIE